PAARSSPPPEPLAVLVHRVPLCTSLRYPTKHSLPGLLPEIVLRRSAFTPPGIAALAALPGLVSLRRVHKQQIFEDTVAGDMEKREHEWQQGVLEAEIIIKALTSPHDLVLDPMCGSGTTLLAAAAAVGAIWGSRRK